MSSSSNNVFPKHRQDSFAVKRWGYKDCYFYYDKEKECLCFKGNKYPALDKAEFKKAREIFKQICKVDIAELKSHNVYEGIPDFEFKHVDCEPFRAEISSKGIASSMELDDRYFRSYGQSVQDLTKICHYRIPDIVLWPKCHTEVEFIVKLANKHNVMIIPYGGGTNVSCSVNCPEYELRTIVSLDTSQMNRLLWLDENSMMACFEAGVAGQNMEAALNEKGFTVGHEPDSFEFSTLGGWVATRSSGIKQHAYGNIEDIVVKLKVVTSVGTFDKACTPRASMGPEIESLMIGSEGTLGVVTEAVIKVHKIPEVKQYGSLLFPTFQHGIDFMKECVKQNCQPASVRLMDNYQLKYGSAVSFHTSLIASIFEFFQLKGLALVVDQTKCAIATFQIEGSKKEVQAMDNKICSIAKNYGAWNGGSCVGEKGYLMTVIVGYMRDMMLRTGALHDSLETSVTWDKCETCLENINECFQNEMTKRGIEGSLSYRISQAYHEGCCIYFYFGINYCENQRENFLETYASLKDALVSSGASLSHHHGIGKRGQDKFSQYLPSSSRIVLGAIKQSVDPKNVFGAGNLIFDESFVEPRASL